MIMYDHRIKGMIYLCPPMTVIKLYKYKYILDANGNQTLYSHI
jgi:hypothetical protein